MECKHQYWKVDKLLRKSIRLKCQECEIYFLAHTEKEDLKFGYGSGLTTIYEQGITLN